MKIVVLKYMSRMNSGWLAKLVNHRRKVTHFQRQFKSINFILTRSFRENISVPLILIRNVIWVRFVYLKCNLNEWLILFIIRVLNEFSFSFCIKCLLSNPKIVMTPLCHLTYVLMIKRFIPNSLIVCIIYFNPLCLHVSFKYH